LVRRSETVLDFDVIDNWNNGFSKMNDGRKCIRQMSRFFCSITWLYGSLWCPTNYFCRIL